jgi:hypothetical protein
MTSNERRDRLLAVAAAVADLSSSAAGLAEELRRLAVVDEGDRARDPGEGMGVPNEETKPTRRNKAKQSAVAVGRRVRVVIVGPYRGRIGTVVRRRGTMYWDVQLDETGQDVGRLIYKMSSSLKVVEE